MITEVTTTPVGGEITALACDDLMTPLHSRWNEFLDRLNGPEGCNFRGEPGKPESVTWDCAGGNDKRLATPILRDMLESELAVQATLAMFEVLGGYCDCEILFNVIRSFESLGLLEPKA